MHGSPSGSTPSLPEVTVVVPCAGELTFLTELVDALAQQHAKFEWEIVFVDNNLSPNEAHRLRHQAGRLDNSVVIGEGEQGISPARNAGVRAARAPVVAFVDADDVPSPSWLESLCSVVSPGLIAAGHLELQRLNPPWLAASRGSTARGVFMCEGLYPVAPGGNLAICVDDFWRVGGLSADFPTLEDFEFGLRAFRDGLQVIPAGLPSSVHYRLRSSVRAQYRQGRAFGLARARIYSLLWSAGEVPRATIQGWKSWLLLGSYVVRAPFGFEYRSKASWVLGNRAGRLLGSIQYRVIYL